MNRNIEKQLKLYDEMELDLKKSRMLMSFSAILFLVIIVGYLFCEYKGILLHNNRKNIIELIIFSPVFVGVSTACYSRRIASRKYKVLLVWTVLENIFENVEYRPDLGLSPNQVHWTNLAEFGQSFSCNDYIKATYKGNNFEQSDVSTSHFKGRVMIFEFNKIFKYNIHVCQKGFKYNKSRADVLYSDERKFEEIELEDMSFNERFNVYAQKQDEAFYVLTPQILERINKLEEKTAGKMLLCFVGNHLHVAINDGRDSFEPPYFKKVNLIEESSKVFEEINVITSFVDELRLDDKIYMS